MKPKLEQDKGNGLLLPFHIVTVGEVAWLMDVPPWRIIRLIQTDELLAFHPGGNGKLKMIFETIDPSVLVNDVEDFSLTPIDPTSRKWLRLSAAASRLHVKGLTLTKWAKEGKVPFRQHTRPDGFVGKRLFREQELLKIIPEEEWGCLVDLLPSGEKQEVST